MKIDRGLKWSSPIGAVCVVVFFGFISLVNASSIRVETLGMTGLMADEEEDLNLNPARLASVQGDRLFLNADLDWNKDEYSYQSSNQRSNQFRFAPSGEYVNVKSPVRWALQYSPQFTRYQSHGSGGDLSSIENAPYNSRLSLGFPVSGTSMLGFDISAGGSDVETRFQSETRSLTAKGISASVGLLGGSPATGQQGLVAYFMNGEEDQSNIEEKRKRVLNAFGVRFLPEKRISESTMFRLVSSVEYTKSERRDDEPPLDQTKQTDKTWDVRAAGGWSIDKKSGDVWTLNVSGGYFDNQSAVSGDPNRGSSDSIFGFGSLTVGCEHSLVADRLLLRASLSPLRMDYRRSNNDDPSSSTTGKDWGVSASGDNATIGLGWTISRKWTADFNLASLSGSYSDSYTHGTSDIYSQSRQNLSIRGSATYKF